MHPLRTISRATTANTASVLGPQRALHIPGPRILTMPVSDAADVTEAPVVPCSTTLTIGDVEMALPDYTLHPERVSWGMPGIDHAREFLMRLAQQRRHDGGGGGEDGVMPESLLVSLRDPVTRAQLRWICQKEHLGQDMCLVGDPGPARRWLMLLYSYLTRREMRVVILNRDVTESDLKQRREIRGGTLVYEDQSAVVAAKEGQLLVLEGLESVERNVLPVINNLLENREMHLDNGAVLIHPSRYDALLQDLVKSKAKHRGSLAEEDRRGLLSEARQELAAMGLLRVSEKFRVVGITVPVPPYDGNPLDPPLRSRFQCLYMRTPPLTFTLAFFRNTVAATTLSPSGSIKGDAALLARRAKAAEARIESVVQLRATIDAVNAATSDFAQSSTGTSSASPSSTSPARGSGASASAASLTNLGNYEMAMLATYVAAYPDLPVGDALARVFPWPLLARQLPGGRDGTSGTGAEEVRHRLAEYSDVMTKCGITAPLSMTSLGTSSVAGKSTPVTRAETASLRTMLSDASFFRGADTAESSAREYVTSAQLVGAGHGAPPTSVARTCNYIERIGRVRCERLGDQGEGEVMVVAEAIVASHSGGGYVMPIFLGRFALTLAGRGAEETAKAVAAATGAREAVDVAAVVPGRRGVVMTTEHYQVLQSMLQAHACNRHMALIGPAGCGKSAILAEFGRLLGYEMDTMHLYADMTSRDLFQRRATDPKTGNTIWENSALVEAAIHGRLVVLDGIDHLPPGVLSALQQLLVDQSANLFDGTVLKPPGEYEILKKKKAVLDPRDGKVLFTPTDADMLSERIFPIHPAFRVVATARVPGEGGAAPSGGVFTLSSDVTTMFSVVSMPEGSDRAVEPVLLQVAELELQAMAESGLLSSPAARRAGVTKAIGKLLQLRTRLEDLRTRDHKITQLSVRQLLHIIRGAVRWPENLASSVSAALLLPLMTGVSATQVKDAMHQCGIDTSGVTLPAGLLERAIAPEGSGEAFAVSGQPVLRITRTYFPHELALVPFVTGFYPNQMHEAIIAWLAKQYSMGASILLIGNQGVGKNKVVDAFLSRVRIPRHYIQLHRDTTVGSLTINPTVENGEVKWEDSPLVKAVQRGHCLVVDEIDKASVEVIQVLKGLVEDREMRLIDGRKIIDRAFLSPSHPLRHGAANSSGTNQSEEAEAEEIILIHPDFRIIVLANPPGFPFHGNDFFRECGDLFSSCVMDNPDTASQLRVLQAYAPNTPTPVLAALVRAFHTLQTAFTDGTLTYPFSLRELIAVVKHISRYPQDGVYTALNNVFFFDACDANTLHYVRNVLAQALQPLARAGGMSRVLPLRAGQPQTLPTLPENLRIPLSGTTAEGPTGAGAEFSSSAPVTVALDTAAFVEALGRSVRASPTWKERYSASAFATLLGGDASAEEDSAKTAAEGMSEWAGTLRMPFIHPETDTVVTMLPVGRYSPQLATTTLVSFLLRRQAKPSGAGAAPAYVLATAHLPPSTALDVSLASSLDGGGSASLTTLGWPAGEVHFIDVTDLVAAGSAAADTAGQPAVVVEDFNLAPHASLWRDSGSAVWPPAATARLASSSSVVAADDVVLPTLLLQLPCSGQVFLIDLMSDTTAAESHNIGIKPTSPTLPQAPAAVEAASPAPASSHRLSGAAVCLGPFPESARVCGVSARAGVVAFVPPAGAAAQGTSVSLVVEGRVVQVRLLGEVTQVRFFSPHLAAVSLRVRPASGAGAAEDRQGVLKLFVEPQAQASFALLPKGMACRIVDVAPTLDGEEEVSARPHNGVLVPADLRGAILVSVPSDSGEDVAATVSTTATTDGVEGGVAALGGSQSSGDVAFMRVEDATQDQLTLRVFTAPPKRQGQQLSGSSGGTGGGEGVLVDAVQHQLIQRQLLSLQGGGGGGGASTDLAVMDTAHGTVRHLDALPATANVVSIHGERGTALAYVARHQALHVADTNYERVQRRHADWSALLNGSSRAIGNAPGGGDGSAVKDFEMKYSSPRKAPSGTLKHGEVDNKEHHGGNTYAGGTGGTDTAGLGGIIGPYRQDKGNPVHQVSPEEKVPQHIVDEARRMGREALQERLKAIGMNEEEYRHYQNFQERVRPSIAQLRTVLMGLKAAEGERTWLKGQTDGIWDDQKLVEGIVGEQNVFKRRVDAKETNPLQSKHKKRVLFVLDVSASMYRFEGMDRRLSKLLESTVMVLESFAGFEHKIDYAMIGHNGDSACIPLVNFGAPPANQKERMAICQKMVAHAQYCWSGDNTVEAMRESIDLVLAEKGDAYFVFVISDSNLRRYGITPDEISSIILSRREVQMFCIFIATLGAQALNLQKQLPVGHGFECMQTGELPHILRQIFTSVDLL